MRIKGDYIIREVEGEYLVVPTEASSIHKKHYIKVNDTGAFLFESLQEATDEDTLVKKLTETYEVDSDTAKKAVAEFLSRLRDHGLLDE